MGCGVYRVDLHTACALGDYEQVRTLLAEGHSPNTVNQGGRQLVLQHEAHEAFFFFLHFDLTYIFTSWLFLFF